MEIKPKLVKALRARGYSLKEAMDTVNDFLDCSPLAPVVEEIWGENEKGVKENEEERKMFYVYMKLVPLNIRGLDALDERRRLGLGDRAELETNNYHSMKFPVEESFARMHKAFKTESTVTIAVPLSALVAGEVKQGSTYVEIYFLTPQRVKDLFSTFHSK